MNETVFNGSLVVLSRLRGEKEEEEEKRKPAEGASPIFSR